ncbi:hypothetical protein LINGRAHAP2_LOCUS12650 [Linum grandiflorum]
MENNFSSKLLLISFMLALLFLSQHGGVDARGPVVSLRCETGEDCLGKQCIGCSSAYPLCNCNNHLCTCRPLSPSVAILRDQN